MPNSCEQCVCVSVSECVRVCEKRLHVFGVFPYIMLEAAAGYLIRWPDVQPCRDASCEPGVLAGLGAKLGE